MDKIVIRPCVDCKKVYKYPSVELGWINEKDNRGQYTGRQLLLCRKCKQIRYDTEIKDMASRMERLGLSGKLFMKTMGYSVSDIQQFAKQWNKYR